MIRSKWGCACRVKGWRKRTVIEEDRSGVGLELEGLSREALVGGGWRWQKFSSKADSDCCCSSVTAGEEDRGANGSEGASVQARKSRSVWCGRCEEGGGGSRRWVCRVVLVLVLVVFAVLFVSEQVHGAACVCVSASAAAAASNGKV